MVAGNAKVIAVGLGVAVVGVLVLRAVGVQRAGAAIGGAAVDAVGGVASGVVGGVGAAVGIPTPDETTTDEYVARWLIDTQGYWTASFWVGVPALYRASMMEEGSGRPPAPGTPLAIKFGTAPYVRPADSAPSVPLSDRTTIVAPAAEAHYDAFGNYLGDW